MQIVCHLIVDTNTSFLVCFFVYVQTKFITNKYFNFVTLLMYCKVKNFSLFLLDVWTKESNGICHLEQIASCCSHLNLKEYINYGQHAFVAFCFCGGKFILTYRKSRPFVKRFTSHKYITSSDDKYIKKYAFHKFGLLLIKPYTIFYCAPNKLQAVFTQICAFCIAVIYNH